MQRALRALGRLSWTGGVVSGEGRMRSIDGGGIEGMRIKGIHTQSDTRFGGRDEEMFVCVCALYGVPSDEPGEGRGAELRGNPR